MQHIIKTRKGEEIILDKEWQELLRDFNWYLDRDGYPTRGCYGTRIRQREQIHRIVMDCPPGYVVDHINRNKLDNRFCNLRVCTHSQNQMNSPARRKNKSSKYKGVYFLKKYKKWCAVIILNRKRIGLGSFDCEHEAAHSYNEGAKKYHGEFAYLNKIDHQPNPPKLQQQVGEK